MIEKIYPGFVNPNNVLETSIFDQYYRKDFEYDDLCNNLTDEVLYHYEDKFEQHLRGELEHLEEDNQLEHLEQIYRDEFSNDELKKQWLKLFNVRSFDNEIAGEMMFYVLISLITKKKKVFLPNGKELRLNCHFFWIQESRTGKDQALKFFVEVVETYNKICEMYGLNKILVGKLDGTESMEVLVDHLIFEQKPKKDKPLKFEKFNGMFSKFDLLYSPEASVYFVEKRGDKQTKSELLLQGLEGTEIHKTLVGWHGEYTKTISDFCFVGTSRPVSNMQNHIVNSGLQQRGLNYMREVSDDENNRMDDKVFLMDKQVYNIGFDFKKELDSFVQLFIKFANFVQITDLSINDDVFELKNILKDKYNKIKYNVSNQEHQQTLRSFIRGYHGLATTLAYNNAYAHFKHEVGKIDYEVAYNILGKEFDMLVDWVQDNIETNSYRNKRTKEFENFVRGLFKSKKTIKQKELVSFCVDKFGLSEKSIYSRLTKLKTNDSFLIFDENTKIFMLKGR